MINKIISFYPVIIFLLCFNIQVVGQGKDCMEYSIATGWWQPDLLVGYLDSLGLERDTTGGAYKFTGSDSIPYPTTFSGGVTLLHYMPQGPKDADSLIRQIQWVLDIRINGEPLNLVFSVNNWTRDTALIDSMEMDSIPYYDERIAAGKADSALIELGEAFERIQNDGNREISIRFMQEQGSGVHADVISGGQSWKNAWERAQNLMDPNNEYRWIWHPNSFLGTPVDSLMPRQWDAYTASTYQISALPSLRNAILLADTFNKPFYHIECGFSGVNDTGGLAANVETYIKPLIDTLQWGVDRGVVKGVGWQNRRKGWFSSEDGTEWEDAVMQDNPGVLDVWNGFLKDNMCTASSVTPGESTNQGSVRVYPVPASTKVTFETDGAHADYYLLKIYDPYGRMILQRNFRGPRVQLSAKDLQRGQMMIYKIINNDTGTIYRGKFMF